MVSALLKQCIRLCSLLCLFSHICHEDVLKVDAQIEAFVFLEGDGRRVPIRLDQLLKALLDMNVLIAHNVPLFLLLSEEWRRIELVMRGHLLLNRIIILAHLHRERES